VVEPIRGAAGVDEVMARDGAAGVEQAGDQPAGTTTVPQAQALELACISERLPAQPRLPDLASPSTSCRSTVDVAYGPTYGPTYGNYCGQIAILQRNTKDYHTNVHRVRCCLTRTWF
jgi:hypothetical protein